jgi:hypothetical protein
MTLTKGRAVRSLRLKLAQQRPHHRVVPQLIVIVQVLIPQRHPEHTLPHQRSDRVLHQPCLALIPEALTQSVDQPYGLIHPAQQQCPGIRAHRPAIKRHHHPATFHAGKLKLFSATLCRHRNSPVGGCNPFS